MGAVDDHSGELGKHAALSLVPQSANPDAGTTSGNFVFWGDQSQGMHCKRPDGTDTTLVDSSAAGSFKPVTVLTTSGLAANTYSASAQTITFNATGAQTVNGRALALNDRVGAFGESSSNNGIYAVTTAPAVGVAGVLTRADDANTSAEFSLGKTVNVSALDTTNGGQEFYISNNSAITLDTTTITVAAAVQNNTAVKAALNMRVGQATLVAGTVTVSDTATTANTRVFLTLFTPNTVASTVSYQHVSNSAGASFVLRANIAAGTINAADISTLNYLAIG